MIWGVPCTCSIVRLLTAGTGTWRGLRGWR
jgi:hypothetical protein